jgi:hypothetical protein
MINEKLYRILNSAFNCFKDKLPSYGVRQNFPRNCCEEVSSILLQILELEGYSSFKMIRGSNLNGEHHFWLETETEVIDLTAHQFDVIKEPFLLINKVDYPLLEIFSEDVQVKFIDNQWRYLKELSPKIINSFYSDYYK